ncbi:F0F1 ATP synthase subunit delta [Leifsonia poae]|uniref:ATP synthase subunit delta n=1 Tax=Leifsonia poae TaxID=110933 RepID=A0A9W6HBB4_9MICO|nr:F0F1 ATP synthase subunit delta [Leifsonia poae]GLJ77389.1 ATP synthase subunit delta [Leifsonia poae]
MGSATREALARSVSALDAETKADLATAEDLFAAGRVVADSAQLRSVISDPSADPAGKAALVTSVFGPKVSKPALGLLVAVARERWSNATDVLAAIEELGIRAIAKSAPADIDIASELFTFGGAVTSNAGLELALRSKLADPAAKAALVDRLLEGKASPQTAAIVRQLVLQPRGRSIREALRAAANTVAAQSELTVATVYTAASLPAAQEKRLESVLSQRYGTRLKINQIVDATLLGGLRVQIGDDVIDGSIASRIHDLRLQLVG